MEELFKNYKDKNILLEKIKEFPDLNFQDKNKQTILMHALLYCKDKDILLEILKQKPKLNIQDNYGYTITMHAFKYCKYKDVLLEILKQNPDLTLKNYYYKTALDIALENYIPNHEFNVLEKLYNENCKQDKQLFNKDYIKLRNKYKIVPLIMFRQQKRNNKS